MDCKRVLNGKKVLAWALVAMGGLFLGCSHNVRQESVQNEPVASCGYEQPQPNPVVQSPGQVHDFASFDASVSWRAATSEIEGLKCLWRSESITNQTRTHPALDNNAIYFNIGGVASINREDGKVAWTYKGKYGGGSNIESSPTVVDGCLLAGTNSYAILSIDCQTGQAKWIYKTGGWVQAPVFVDREGDRVFAGAWDKLFHALKLSTGEGLWTYPTQARVGEKAALVGDLVCFADNSTLVCLEAKTGKHVASKDFGSSLASGPIALDKSSFVLWCGDGTLRVFEVSGARKSKEIVEKASYPATQKFRNLQKGFPHTEYLWLGKKLLILNDNGVLVCYDADKSTLAWTAAENGLSSVAEWKKGTCLAAKSQGGLCCLDLETGEAIWKANLPGVHSPSLATCGDYVYASGSRDGSVTAYMAY